MDILFLGSWFDFGTKLLRSFLILTGGSEGARFQTITIFYKQGSPMGCIRLI